MDLALIVGSALIGVVVGLTGMGGGALMTPMLILFFGVPPLAAVSSDLVAAAVMKPVGGLVHLRRGTVHLPLVGYLCLGSVPAAFAGVLVARSLGSGSGVQKVTTVALGVALLVAAVGLVAKSVVSLRRVTSTAGPLPPEVMPPVRPLPTVAVGALGGLVVGMTSVGSGSLVIVALLVLYPVLSANGLVGTDLVQAVPMVAAAAVGHLVFGDFQLQITTSLLLGSVPGVYLGARLSSRAPAGLVRRALALVLVASGLRLLGVPYLPLGVVVAVLVAVGPLVWTAFRRRHGLDADNYSLRTMITGSVRS